MATTELDKTLNRMKVTMKAVELAGTPARGFSPTVRNWRVTLTKEGKGDDKPQKLTLVILSANEPTLAMVVETLAKDISDSEMTLWDFAQEYNKGKTGPNIELMHKTCKRIVPRIRKFFGESWGKLAKTIDLAA